MLRGALNRRVLLDPPPLALRLAAMITLCGCAHDLPIPPQGGPDSGSAADQGGRGSDTGREQDLPAFPYTWQHAKPAPEADEVRFDLDCTGGPPGLGRCRFECSLDNEPFQTCTDRYELYVFHGEHRFCVTVFAPSADQTTYATDRATSCVEWVSGPDGVRMKLLDPTLPSDSTSIAVPLLCHRDDATDPEAVATPDCEFKCSVDHQPYSRCAGTLEVSGLAPGQHELRVDVCPTRQADLDLGIPCDLFFARWTVNPGAQPEVKQEPVNLPPLLTDDELQGLHVLIAPYARHAHRCDPKSEPAPEQPDSHHGERMRAYLSYSLGRGFASVRQGDIAACLAALEDETLQCPSVEGLPVTYMRESVLDVRLTWRCVLFDGQLEIGERCLTSAECRSGVCERGVDFAVGSELGWCANNEYDFGIFHEDIMCLTRGCFSQFFHCKQGLCAPLLEEGAPCLWEGDVGECDFGRCEGSPPRCVRLSAVGEACEETADCFGSNECDAATGLCTREEP